MLQRDRYQRLVAKRTTDSAEVDLGHDEVAEGRPSCSPNPTDLSAGVDLRSPAGTGSVTKEFERKASKLGFEVRFHDTPRRTHRKRCCLTVACPYAARRTVVATIRRLCSGNRAKRTRKADTIAASVIGSITKGILGN